MSPKMLTPQQVSEWLGVPLATLSTMRARPSKDPIPFIKVGRLVRYPEDRLQEWVERNTFFDTHESKKHRAS